MKAIRWKLIKKNILLISILLSIGALPTFANKYIYNENAMHIQKIEETTQDRQQSQLQKTQLRQSRQEQVY